MTGKCVAEIFMSWHIWKQKVRLEEEQGLSFKNPSLINTYAFEFPSSFVACPVPIRGKVSDYTLVSLLTIFP